MCRNIKLLFNFEPAVTPDEVRAASLQFVRKISGFDKPSKANEAAFAEAVDGIAAVSMELLGKLVTNAPAKNREEEAAKLKALSAKRFGGVT
jgi:hypothetical protein